jgi:hypothetical protein
LERGYHGRKRTDGERWLWWLDGSSTLSPLRCHLLPINIACILREQDQDGDDGKEEAEEKPKPAASSAILRPQRAKRSKQKEHQTLVSNLSDLLLERGNAMFELADALRLGLGKGSAAEKHCKQEEEVDALHNFYADV